ncbi:hypothetical protein JAAARDRAFT_253960 [Jaapia argillacea MUCL 33604]|uniref:Protein kinase domain-containing protein n=1 Tax=Jaapia argillacea MUCL 33604 TaxID=933084 RepID=A0A067PT56_9AGAM|nr:hypothetical protein JAAARDRAFT_253960 [Jaapia argillacea MUCL 33604]
MPSSKAGNIEPPELSSEISADLLCRDRARGTRSSRDSAVPPSFVGNIYQEIQRNPHVASNIVAAFASRLRELHDSGIIHGDLTPECVLVDGLGQVFLFNAQVAFARRVKDYHTKQRVLVPVSWVYQPHEQLMAESSDNPDGPPYCSAKGDVFAFATIIYESFGGQLRRGRKALVQRIEAKTSMYVMARPHLLTDDRLWHLLLKSWSQDPEQRPSMREIEDALLYTSA